MKMDIKHCQTKSNYSVALGELGTQLHLANETN